MYSLICTLFYRRNNKELLNSVKPCPVCGRMPKMYFDDDNICCRGGFTMIQCKPFLRKRHHIVEEGKASFPRSVEYAIKRWNDEVEQMNKRIR